MFALSLYYTMRKMHIFSCILCAHMYIVLQKNAALYYTGLLRRKNVSLYLYKNLDWQRVTEADKMSYCMNYSAISIHR